MSSGFNNKLKRTSAKGATNQNDGQADTILRRGKSNLVDEEMGLGGRTRLEATGKEREVDLGEQAKAQAKGKGKEGPGKEEAAERAVEAVFKVDKMELEVKAQTKEGMLAVIAAAVEKGAVVKEGEETMGNVFPADWRGWKGWFFDNALVLFFGTFTSPLGRLIWDKLVAAIEN